MTKNHRTAAGVCLLLVIVGFAVSTQLTLLVVPPIGAVPDGRTVVISRTKATNFVDSPDAVCERIQGGVSLLCRGLVMGQLLNGATIYARLPYSDVLYVWSTGGKRYER